MIKAIYYSRKMKKYYFNNVTAFGQYFAETVYGGENLIGGEIKTDKNDKQYIVGYVSECVSPVTGRKYFKCTGYVEPKSEVKEEMEFLTNGGESQSAE